MSVTHFLNSDRGKQLMLLVFGALILNGAVVWFYDLAQWASYQANQAKTEGLKTDILAARRLAFTVAQTAVVRGKMQQFIEAHEATMVGGDQFAWVIREISQLAESQPVANVIIQPGAVAPHSRKPIRQCYVTHLEFTGDYDQIGTFIQTLENHFPEGEIRSLNIGATDAPTIHRVTLDLALLIRPVPVAPAGLAPSKSVSKS